MLKIAKEEGIDPGTVSSWLKKLGVSVRPGHHFVRQPPLRIPMDLLHLLEKGSSFAEEFALNRVWGVKASKHSQECLEKFCQFLEMYNLHQGVEEIASELRLHRSTVAKWREGTDFPYLVKLTAKGLEETPGGGQWLPIVTSAGGNLLHNWVIVPKVIVHYEDVLPLLMSLKPTEDTEKVAVSLGLEEILYPPVRPELFAYLLGAMVGDVAKEGGPSRILTSSNLDFQLTQKNSSNERFGELVSLCCNMLGVPMGRSRDKAPTGATLKAKDPSSAFRWVSARSPLISWIYAVCIGIPPDGLISYDRISMDWILDSPTSFRKRFIQGMADSDGTVKDYVVEIVSVPNSEFVSRILKSLGIESCKVVVENGKPLRVRVHRKEAAALPMFNEWARSYRFEKLVGEGRR